MILMIENRVRLLREEPYTQKEAEAAVGIRAEPHQSKNKGSTASDQEVMEVESTEAIQA